jgi:predicted lipid-binding transport protein (Tim44 family)
MQRLRPTLVALAILALSATAVFAAGPARPEFAPGSHQPEASESAEPSEAPEATETAEATEAAEASEAARPSDGAEASHPMNHGCVVSLAAKTATPSGFKNHGQWVSSIAKNNPGHNQSVDTNTCTLPTGGPAPSANR